MDYKLKLAISRWFQVGAAPATSAVCYSPDPYGVGLYPATEPPADTVFFSINLLRESRKDSNVVDLRNFLIELDQKDMTIEQQRSYIKALGMPYTTCTYSGNKSCHYIISLADPLPDRETYDFYARWLHNAVALADHSTKNPSRFSRFPGAINPKTGKVQELLECLPRVLINKFDLFLEKFPKPMPMIKATTEIPATPQPITHLRRYTLRYLSCGAGEGERTPMLFKCACDLAENGYPLSQAVQMLFKPIEKHLDFNPKKAYNTIQDAYKRVGVIE